MTATQKPHQRSTFTPDELNQLRAQWNKVNTVNPDHLGRFRKLLAECADEALKQLAGANIKFLSKLAVNACLRRGIGA